MEAPRGYEMKQYMTKKHAKNLGEAVGILAVGIALALLWLPFFHLLLHVYGWCV